MIGNKNPSSTVYWNDILDDKALKACSLAARGLWLQVMLPLAASCETDPGYVIVEGMPSKLDDLPETLARMGAGGTVDEIRDLLAEIVTKKVAGIDRGYVFNRRMVEAHGLSAKRSGAGKKGAAATHGRRREIHGLPRQNAGNDAGKPSGIPADKPTGNDAGKTAPSSLLHTSDLTDLSSAPSPGTAREAPAGKGCAAPGDSPDGEAKASLAFDVERCALSACELAGLPRDRAATDRLTVEAWVRRWNIDTQIEPAIRAAAARPNFRPPQSLAYFTAIIAQFVDDVGSRPVSEGRASAPSRSSAHGEPWDLRVNRFKADEDAIAAGTRRMKPFWSGNWGPKPSESGCWAPREVLLKHGYRRADA